MKKIFYSLLLAAVFGLFGTQVWAQDTPYEIANAQDLVDFADAVNSGDYTLDAILTADIDMAGTEWNEPIGNWSVLDGANVSYKGHFDGNGKTIKGLTYTTKKNYHGLFGVLTDGAVVENFTIYGDITNADYDAIAVVGYTKNESKEVVIRGIHSYLNITNSGNDKKIGGILGNGNVGKTIVDRCWFSGTLSTTNKANVGGIAGYIQNNTSTFANFTNCLFDGTITATVNNAYCGGIVGYIGANQTAYTVTNCLSVGEVEATVAGAIFGYVRNCGAAFSDNYYISGTTSGKTENAGANNVATVATEEQALNGELCFLLNGSVSGGENWFQMLNTKTYSAEQYVVTADGTKEEPTTANVTLSDAGDGTYTFTLPNFVLKILGRSFSVGDISLSKITINSDGTFQSSATYSVPEENIPEALKPYAASFQDMPYTLDGKVNNDALYAVIDLSLKVSGTDHTVNVVVGTDDFEPATPTGEAYPTPIGDAKIYINGRQHCNGDVYEDGATYSNADLGVVKDEHIFVGGFCSYCGEYDATYMAANSDGVYEIANAQQLVWFAAMVNAGTYDAKALLVADIDMADANISQFPIGSGGDTDGKRYVGTFDGQGHTISNFQLVNASAPANYGMFNTATGVVLKNFILDASCAIQGTELVGIVGRHYGGGTFEGIGNLADVTGTNNNVGGLLGAVMGNSKDKKDVVLRNCWTTGKVETTNPTVGNGKDCGAFSGWFNNAIVTFHGCWTIADVVNPKSDALYCFRYGGGAVITYENCFSMNGAQPNFTNFDDAQLANGFLANGLGADWSQYIGRDAMPVLGGQYPVSYVGAAGYATMYDTTTGYELNGDVQAYVAVTDGDYLVLSQIENVPAATPVVLKGTYYNKVEADLPAINVANELKGTDADTEADGTMYVLADDEAGVAFYRATGTIPAGKAYYKGEGGSVKTFRFADDATGIAELQQVSGAQEIYNIAGQRLQKVQKGINIIGGKKILR